MQERFPLGENGPYSSHWRLRAEVRYRLVTTEKLSVVHPPRVFCIKHILHLPWCRHRLQQALNLVASTLLGTLLGTFFLSWKTGSLVQLCPIFLTPTFFPLYLFQFVGSGIRAFTPNIRDTTRTHDECLLVFLQRSPVCCFFHARGRSLHKAL